MKDYTLEFRKSFGGITNFLTTYCGYRLVKPGINAGLWCPNHADSETNRKGGNCHSNDAKDVWYCYSCANQGTAIHKGSYVEACMANMNMDRKEAFRWLCDKAGISIGNVEYDPVDIRRMFVEICHKNLMTNMNSIEDYMGASQYIASRGFILRTLKTYRIGYSNSSELKELNAKGISKEMLIKAGILHLSKKGKYYNAFRNRVVMMVGNSLYGRDIRPTPYLKHYYSNSGNSIFNTLSCIGEKDIIFVVESAFDALTIQQYINRLGKPWAVIATCGTQGIKIEELMKFIKEMNPVETVFIPDNDPWVKDGVKHAPGQMAVIKKAKEFVKNNFAIRILVLPENSDPNDLSKNQVRARDFENMVNKALPFVPFEIYCASHFFDLKFGGAKTAFLEKVKRLIGTTNIPATSLVINQVSKLVNMKPVEVRDYLQDTLKENLAVNYYKRLIAKGLNDEDVIQHIKSLIATEK